MDGGGDTLAVSADRAGGFEQVPDPAPTSVEHRPIK
jgi:hypothetical protein